MKSLNLKYSIQVNNQWEESFVNQMGLKDYSKDTVRNYLWHFRHFAAYHSQIYPYNFSHNNFTDYANMLVNELMVGSSTHNQAINAIKFFFRFVLNKKIVEDKFIRPVKTKSVPETIPAWKIQKLIDGTENLKHKLIIFMLYATGMRVSEIINLKKAHILETEGIINIIRGKGKKDRKVMLDEKLLELLNKYYAEYNPVEYVFNGWKNELQYTVRSIEKMIADKSMKILGEHLHPHQFRHAFITDCLDNDMDSKFVKDLAGHTRLSTTEAYYHVSNKRIASLQSPASIINI